MKISGQQCINASIEAIWQLIFEPDALLRLVPGCDQVKQGSADEYYAHLTLQVPALTGSYEIHIKILEQEAPHFCRLMGSAQGSAGGVQGHGTITLAPQGPQTRIEYTGEAEISGPLAGMPPRFVEGVAKMLIHQGFIKLADLVRNREGFKRIAETPKALNDEESPKPGIPPC
jgi:carbon monoxide dehydrogenase subunit G